MLCHIWIPGSDNALDAEFNRLRQIQENSDHKLSSNYICSHFSNCEALSMVEQNGKIISCSSILHREIWPKGTFRVLNRLWKPVNRVFLTREASAVNVLMLKEQIEWLKVNRYSKLFFISRNKENWTSWAIKMLNQKGLYFKTNDKKYLTCENEDDLSCWQKIIYQGDDSLLYLWKTL